MNRTFRVDPRDADHSSDALYPVLRHHWHPVAYAAEVGADPVGVTLLDEPIVVFRHRGTLVALQDRCLHRSARLSLGTIADDGIECAYHGWRYSPEGHCIRLPAVPAARAAVKARVPAYQVAESAGLVWIALDTPRTPIPAFPEFDDPAFRVLRGPGYEWRTSAARRLENFCDFAHFSFIHDGTLGSRAHPEVAPVDVWREGPVLRVRRGGILEPNVSNKKALLEIDDEWIAPVNEYHISFPHTVHLKRIFPNGKRYVLLMSVSPVTAERSRSFWWQARDFGTAPEHDAFFLAFEAKILAEDIDIVESQHPRWIPLGGHAMETSVMPADQVSIAYRRGLMELVAEQRRATRKPDPTSGTPGAANP